MCVLVIPMHFRKHQVKIKSHVRYMLLFCSIEFCGKPNQGPNSSKFPPLTPHKIPSSSIHLSFSLRMKIQAEANFQFYRVLNVKDVLQFDN